MNEIIQSLSDIDTNVLLFFNGIHSPFWDYFMSAFTGKVICSMLKAIGSVK